MVKLNCNDRCYYYCVEYAKENQRNEWGMGNWVWKLTGVPCFLYTRYTKISNVLSLVVVGIQVLGDRTCERPSHRTRGDGKGLGGWVD